MKKSIDAVKHLYDTLVRGDPEAEMWYEIEDQKFKLIDQLRSLREKAGFSQRQLAKKLKMRAKVIENLEDPNCDNRSLEDLMQVLSSFGFKLEFDVIDRATQKSVLKSRRRATVKKLQPAAKPQKAKSA